MTNTQTLLTTAFPELNWQPDYSLAQDTYFKIGGPAELYLELSDIETLAAIRAFCHQNNLKITMLGGASNVIIADEGIAGVVIKFSNKELKLLEKMDSERGIIYAGAGIQMALLVSQVIQLGYKGLEYFLGVPGTLGGAVYNNSHYLSHLIGEHIQTVHCVTTDGQIVKYSQAECDFAYDHSRFQHTKESIVAVEFELSVGDKAASMELIKEATQYRANTQPLGIPNSGCIFQNVPNTPSLKEQFPQFADRTHVSGGFLIDQAGMKGTRVGNVEVSNKHAAFIINLGQGKATDVKELISQVKQRVFDRFGVELHEEVFYLA